MALCERRKRERRPYINSVEIYSYENKKDIDKGFVMNWCEDGFGIVSRQVLKIGKKIVLFFDLPSGMECDFLGEVVHAEKRLDSTAYGVKLLPGQKPCVERFLEQLSAA